MKKITFLLISFLLLGCTFNFSEDYYNDIELSEVDIDFNLINFVDGEELKSSKDVLFQFSSNSHQLYNAEVYLNGERIYIGTDKNGTFELDITNIETGNHQLRVEYAYSTNSGSYADLLGAEAFQKVDNYTFSVDRSLADPFEIASIEIRDGTIFVNWDPIEDQNFENAYLIVTYEDVNITREILLTEEDLEAGYFNDNQTFYYDPIYQIRVDNFFGDKTSDVQQLTTEKMEVTMEPSTFRDYTFSWSRHPLYSNISRLELDYYYTYPDRSIPPILNRSLDPLGGQIELQGYHFGTPKTFHFEIIENNDDNFQHGIAAEAILGSELDISSFEDIVYSKLMDRFYVLLVDNGSELYLNEYDGNFNTLRSQLITSFVDNEFVNLQLDQSENVLNIDLIGAAIEFDLATFQILNTYSANDYAPGNATSKVRFRDGTLIIEENILPGEVLIFDSETSAQIAQLDIDHLFGIGYDPNYFFIDDTIYEKNNDTYQILDVLSLGLGTPIEYALFDNSDGKLCFGSHTSRNVTTTIYDLTTSSQTTLFNSGRPARQISFTENSEVFTIGDYNSAGLMASKYNIGNASTSYLRIGTDQNINYWYLNGYIISSNGYYYKSDFYLSR